jgi:hypothetical protein
MALRLRRYQMIKALLDRDYHHREIVETGHGSSRVKTAPTPAAPLLVRALRVTRGHLLCHRDDPHVGSLLHADPLPIDVA